VRSSQDGLGDDLAALDRLVRGPVDRAGYLLSQPLMGARDVEVGVDVLLEHGAQVVLAEDEDVVEILAPYGAKEAFADRREVRRSRRMDITSMPAPLATASNFEPYFPSLSQMRNHAPSPHEVASRSC
jgi:hypothetical protein